MITLSRLLFLLAAILSPVAVHAAEASFAGSGTCTECHANEVKAWEGSHHGWALREASAPNVLGDFSGVSFSEGGITSRFFMQDGRYMVETDGPDGKPTTYQVRFTVGVTPLQQYLVETDKGKLQALDVAWDTEKRKWFHLYPGQVPAAGDGMHWSGTYKNWQSRCAECHQTGFDKGYDAKTGVYNTKWSELTVSCESCHGPASEHVAWARMSPRPASAPAMLKLGPGEQANELAACGPCHARREAFSQKSAPVGAPMSDHYNLSLLSPDLYFPDGQQNAEVFILGSFLQSKMKAKGVTCSNCHEAHSGSLVAEGNAVCTQCHNPAGNERFPSLAMKEYDSEAHHHHKPGTEAAACVTCHMPERTYMVNDGRRDHFFRRPDPLQSKAAGAPDVCTDCHKDQTAEWAAEQIGTWHPDADHSWQDRSAFIAFTTGDRSDSVLAALAAYAQDVERPAITRATALTFLRDAAPPAQKAPLAALLADGNDIVRVAAAGLLRDAEPSSKAAQLSPLLGDRARAVRHAAALELASSDPALLSDAQRTALGSALGEYVASREANADMPEAHMAMGGLALSLRRWPEAEAAFAQASSLDPQLEQAWVMLTRIKAALGDDAAAERYLGQGLAKLPDSVPLLLERASLESRRGNDTRAIDWYRRILAKNPDQVEAWFQLAFAALRTGNGALAVDAAGKAVSLEPGNAEAHLALAYGYYLLKDTEKARAAALEARRLSPGMQLPQEIEALLKG